MKNIFIALLITASIGVFWTANTSPKAFHYLDQAYNYMGNIVASVGDNLAAVISVISHKPVTVAKLQTAYKDPTKKVRILIVPGHEPGYGGAEYADLKEREMNVELAQDLGSMLKNNSNYDVMLTRDDTQWSPAISDYFKNNWQAIIDWEKASRIAASQFISVASSTSVTPSTPTVFHNTAPADVAYRLYGITKWANENAIDIEIHIHFNDNPGEKKYSGFAIYVPAGQYYNSATTKAIATTVFKRLGKYNPVSNLPGENSGIVDEPELIAIGAHNTADAASMLIEYGYIYEPQFQNPDVRSSIIKDMAFQTYLGIEDFFGSGSDIARAYDTLMLPHSWNSVMTQANANTNDVLSLQTALALDGFYPANGQTKNDCPRSGKIGPCTLTALKDFQKAYGIKGEDGIVGVKTQKMLNQKYSVRAI